MAKKGFSLCGADGDVQLYQKELAFYDAVRAILAKREPNSTASSEERQLQLVALLNKAVDASGAINLFDLLNREQPNINILSEEFLEKIKNSQTKELWLLAVERYLRSQINEKGTGNLAVQKDFAERLKQALNQYHNQNLTIMMPLPAMKVRCENWAMRR